MNPMLWNLLGLMGGLIALGFLFAKVEIQIEGGQGWAAGLPTWRLERHVLLNIFWGGRPLTGYHVWIFSFMAGVFHLPLLLTGTASWMLEIRILGSLMVFWILEDFFWFVFNPAYGLRRFRREQIPWHKHWIGPVPTDYASFMLVGGSLLLYSYFYG